MGWEEKSSALSIFTKFVVGIFLLGFLTSMPLHAQVAGGQLSGTVTDNTGAVIPGAKITALNMATNVTSSTTSNGSGAYTITNLVPGQYTVTAMAPGFSQTRTTLTLTVGATQLMNFSLKVGGVQQVVTVTGAAPAINLTSPTISGQVTQSQIVQLPLNGRDWASLATLQPGVVQMREQEVVTQPGGDLRGLGNQDAIDGNRATQNVYRLNGLIVNDYSNAGPGNVLGDNAGVDAIQEFSVLTTNYSAQYGYTSGGVINAVTKSGTNQWHGEGYEFLRNSYFDANPFFDNLDKTKPGNFVRNQFGAALGGPLKHNKLFVFGNYEGIRQSQAVPSRTKVLTQAGKEGIIPGVAPFTGSCPYANMTNEAPGQAAFCVDNTEYKAINELMPLPSPGIPLIDADVGYFAFDAKQVVSGNYETVRIDYDISNSDHMDFAWYQDHSLWSKPSSFNATLSGFTVPHNAYSLEETHVFSPSLVNTIRVGLSESKLGSPSLGIVSGTPLAAGLTDTSFGILPGLTASGTGALAGEVGVVGVSGISGGFLPNTSGFARGQGLIQGYDDADKTIGKHDLKFGFMFIRNWDDFLNSNGPGNGSVSYSSFITELENIPSTIRMPLEPPVTALPVWHNFRANIIAGYLDDTYRMTSNLTWDLGVRYEMQTVPVEVSPGFFSIPQLYTNPSSCQAPTPAGCPSFRGAPIYTNNSTLKDWMPRIGFAWDPFKTGKTSIRGGFGMFDVLPQPWQLGLNTLQTAPSGTEVDLNCNGASLDGPALAGGLNIDGTSINGQPLPCQGIWPKGILPLEQTYGTSPPKRVNYDQPNPGLGYVLQWNFSVQRQITPNFTITAAYLGSRGIHQPFQTDELNTVFPYKTPYGYLFPNPVGSGCISTNYPTSNPLSVYNSDPCSQTDLNLGLPGDFSVNPTKIVPGLLINPYTALIQSTIWQAQSWYRAMTISAVRRVSHGFYIQGSFTWQRSLDTSSSSFAGDNYASDVTPTIPWWDLSLTKGPSDFNVGRTLVINSLYELPGSSLHGPAAVIAKGWELGGILTLSDGIPLWPLDGLEGDPMGQLNGEPLAVPQMVPGCNPVNPGSVQYLNPACFENQQAPSLAFYNAPAPMGCDPSFAYPTCINLLGTGRATLHRNQIVGPGEFNLDTSLLKNFPIPRISEGFDIQFQANAFNLLNHVNLSAPVNNLEPISAAGTPVAGFGQVTSTETPNRELQFALKVIF